MLHLNGKGFLSSIATYKEHHFFKKQQTTFSPKREKILEDDSFIIFFFVSQYLNIFLSISSFWGTYASILYTLVEMWDFSTIQHKSHESF